MQSKRRAHSVIIDHLTPPMTTADGYGELAQLMQLVDEYYQIEMLDPSKMPLIQKQIWELIQKINLDEGMHFLKVLSTMLFITTRTQFFQSNPRQIFRSFSIMTMIIIITVILRTMKLLKKKMAAITAILHTIIMIVTHH